MKSRDVVIGFIFLVVLIAGTFWLIKNRNLKKLTTPLPTPNITSEVNKAFPNLTVPKGGERADLNRVSGSEGVGVATRQKTNSQTTITVMANLPTPQAGNYQAAVTNGTQTITLGKMEVTKSGYLVNFVTVQDLNGYNKVIVSNGNSNILEGSF